MLSEEYLLTQIENLKGYIFHPTKINFLNLVWSFWLILKILTRHICT